MYLALILAIDELPIRQLLAVLFVALVPIDIEFAPEDEAENPIANAPFAVAEADPPNAIVFA